MDSDKEVNLSGKNLTPFSIADILSGSSKASAENPPVIPVPPPSTPPSHPPSAIAANVPQPSYPWFLFNHPPCWPLMLPDASAQAVGSNGGTTLTTNGQADISNSSALTTVSSSPEDDDLDRLSDDDDELFDQDEDDDGSIIGSLISSTDEGQQEDALDMRASHRQHRRRNRTRKTLYSNLVKRLDFSRHKAINLWPLELNDPYPQPETDSP